MFFSVAVRNGRYHRHIAFPPSSWGLWQFSACPRWALCWHPRIPLDGGYQLNLILIRGSCLSLARPEEVSFSSCCYHRNRSWPSKAFKKTGLDCSPSLKCSFSPTNKPPQSSVSGGYDDFMWKQDVPVTETPYFSIAPPRFSPAPFWVCVCTLSVCCTCEGSVTAASHCPIIPAPLTLCILWGFLLMRQRVREKMKGKKRDGETRKRGGLEKVWAEQRSGVKVQKLNRSEQSCMCVCVCVALCSRSEFPAGSSLSAVHCAGKGVSFGFGCMRVWRWRVMLLWFYKRALNACWCFVSRNLFASS